MTRSGTASSCECVAWVLLELLVGSDLVASVADLAAVRAFLRNGGHALPIDWTTSLPSVTLARLVKVIDEVALVVLTSNDAFLGSCHPRGEHTLTRTHLLRGAVLLIGKAGHLKHLRRRFALHSGIKSLVLIVACVEQQGLEAEGLALKSAILDIIV